MDVSAISDAASGLARSISATRRTGNPFNRVLAAAQQQQANSTGATSSTDAEQALAGIKQRQDQSLNDLQSTLNNLFQSAGIDTSQDIKLQLGSDGKVSLANNHPDHDKIDRVLAAHPELAAKFQALANTQRQLEQQQQGGASADLLQSTFSVTLTDGQATAQLG